MSSWDNAINLAAGTITSGNIVSSAGNSLADTSLGILTLLDLTTNSEGGLASIAVKVIDKLKEKQAKQLEKAKAAQDDAESTLALAIELRAAAMFQEAKDPAAVAKIRQDLGIPDDKPVTIETIQAALKKKVEDRVAPLETKVELEGSTMRGDPPLTFGQAITALSADPNDANAKTAVTGLLQQMKEMKEKAADPAATASGAKCGSIRNRSTWRIGIVV